MTNKFAVRRAAANSHEEFIKVTCTCDAVNGQFAVRVYTTLNSGARDESFFGIDNAVLKKYTAAPACKAPKYIKNNKCVVCPKGSTCDGNGFDDYSNT